MNMQPRKIADEALISVSGGLHEDQEIINAQKLRDELNGKIIRVTLLYCVEVKEIASAIREQLGVCIDKKSIEIPEIKKTGTYNFRVKIATGIVAAMTVQAV